MRRRYRSLGQPSSVLLALFIALAAFAQQSGAAGGDTLEKIEPALVQKLQAGGTANFFVLFGDRAGLTAADSISNWEARGQFVYDALTQTAQRSQARALDYLSKRAVPHQSFFIVNTVRVTADLSVAQELAALSEVDRIVAEHAYRIPKPLPGSEEPGLAVPGWNIAKINADDVWNSFGITGQGIVVGTIDTGVEYTHSALVNQYRGNLGGGSFDHNYNWWDPSRVCGAAGSPPCDNVNHGTHTMGTIAGGDGPGPFTNDIGVAPGARWIAAKGCETDSCSDAALLSSGQFMLAPTDVFGSNPMPGLRPHIASNSWGDGPGDTFYQATVQAWRAAGIFPAFAIGNAGPLCGSAGSPGDYAASFGVGATDINDAIAGFSGRGPSALAPIKPEVSAPGVDVRSSVPGNGYAAFSGTSMATPHVAGMVAILWSGNPALIGDIPTTFDIIKSTAVDRPNLSCGGDPDGDPNNVYGDGRIDVFAACVLYCGASGALTGVVTDSVTSLPIGGALVKATRQDDGLTLTATTLSDGTYQMRLPVDPEPGPELYDVTASAFAYSSQTAPNVEILADATTVQDFALSPLPRFTASGTVTEATTSEPLPGTPVCILATPLPCATADNSGFYSIPNVPQGEYDIEASGQRCLNSQVQHVIVDSNETVNFSLNARSDAFGYTCRIVPIQWVNASRILPLRGDDSFIRVSLGFPFSFYGQTYLRASVTTNGFLSFTSRVATFINGPIPSLTLPNAAIYPFWDDLLVSDIFASIKTSTFGLAPDRVFVLEYENVRFLADPTRINFEAVLFEKDGRILFQYRSMPPGRGSGEFATIGIENAVGNDALQYSFNEPAVQNGFAILFTPP